jgi:integrase
MGAIDWINDRLYINQQKTDVPLGLPLTAIVGNALHDYLIFERPESDSDYIFISSNRPFGRLKDRSVGNISIKIMSAAGIRQSKGDRRGLHIFRHHLATELLGNDIPQPVISRVVGHTAPNSLEPYLRADFKHLKECALSIEKYPLPKGVLCNA